MDLDQAISDFLRDAQYKLALITIEMDGNENDGDVHYQNLKESRWELDYFYSILLETSQSLEGGYNWLEAAGWTDKDILNEIHYQRNKHQLNGMPIVDYQHTVQQVIHFVQESQGGGSGLPPSTNAGNILISTAGGGWEEGQISKYVGMLDSESLLTYFASRT